jgi:purine-binding chemotaxis protein CheW
MGTASQSVLIAKVGPLTTAVPIEHVVETMRPLPAIPLGHAPAFVRGLAIIRGVPVVVIDTAALLGVSRERDARARYVIVRADARRVALEVDAVLDVRQLSHAELAALPGLVHADAVATIGADDVGLIVVLEAARAVPPEVWAQLEAQP